MPNRVPRHPKIYHILHIDKLSSVVNDNYLFSDAIIHNQNPTGTTIGMSKIKERRLNTLTLSCYPDLHVGDCVPFYFCPRSVMLYMFNAGNHPEITYRGGQKPIIHLEADLHKVVAWADEQKTRWAFTLSNAGAYYAEYRNKISQLNEINWNAINQNYWQSCRDEKQAEFLIEEQFPMELVERIGVYSKSILERVESEIVSSTYSPQIEIKRDWYY